MSQETAIAWTDLSWNPTFGCSRVSEGCGQPSGGGCYAEALALRWGLSKAPWTAANAAENVLLKPHKLREPLSNAKAWRGLGAAAAAAGKTDGKLVFVNSMSDLFHEQIPDEYIAEVFGVMAEAERHTFQVLTKRPERMRDLLSNPVLMRAAGGYDWPLPNVWLGVSIENRKWVGRADVLRATPAAVRFISAEPLLGPLIAPRAHLSPVDSRAARRAGRPLVGAPYWPDGWSDGGPTVPTLDLTDIDWLIVGGESGPGHRPMDLQWARDLRDACFAMRPKWPDLMDHGIGRPAFFMKQIGGTRPGTALEDLPADLRIREFPVADV